MKKHLSKFFCLLLVICMVIAMLPVVALAGPVTPRPSKLYLKPNSNWLEADARFAAYYYSGSDAGVWEDMSDPNGDGIYEVSVPSTFDNVIFCRMNPTASVNSWGSKWNQTSDLVIPLNGNNLYTVEEGSWDYGNGTWSVLGSSGTTDPQPTTVDYYLVGYINGVDYGCNEDYQNLGIYKFVDNRLTCTFTSDSYVFLKTSDNAKWFMAESYCTSTTCTMMLSGTEKMFVPGGVEVNFSLIINDDSSVILSYYTTSVECDHSYTSKVTIPATCTGQSQTEFTCTLCGNQYWVIGAANGHSYEAAVTTAATCTTEGIKTFTCSACDASYTEVIPATGHSYANGKCTVCGTADANCSHSYSSKVTIAATCLEDGVKTYTCSKCGDVYTEAIPATGHSYVDEIVPPSCELNGYTKHRCEYCGAYTLNTDPVNPLGHDEVSVVTAPTCTEQGYTTFTCNRCGQVREWYYTQPTGHSFAGNTCTTCGFVDADYEFNYYLAGYINGADYGCNDDYQNMGEFKFVDGKLTATFTQDSYVFVKTTNNETWYMSTYFATQKYVTLYSTDTGANEKLYVPGNVKLVFNLEENADGSITLRYAVDPDACSHSVHTTSGSCFNCGLIVKHTYVDGVCICGAKDPTYGDTEKIYYLFGISGSEYNGYDHPFVEGKLTLDVPVNSYVWVIDNTGAGYVTDGWQGEVSSVTLMYEGNVSGTPDKLMIPAGTVTLTLVDNGDGTFTLSYELISQPEVSYYLVGYINGANYGCDEDWENVGQYRFVNGSLTVTFQQDSYVFIKTGDNAKWYMLPAYDDDGNASFYLTSTGTTEKMFVPGGVEVIFSLEENWDGSLIVKYVVNEDCAHDMHDANGICTACGRNIGHNMVNGGCTVCGLICSHNYIDSGVCTICGHQLPIDYYLFGYINGANYGCEEDAATWGAYKFVDGKLVVTFTQDSYVAVKATNNVWYMCEGYDATATIRTMYSASGLGRPEKMFVPGGVEVTFTLETFSNRVVLSYTTAADPVIVPTLTLNYPSLSFEDEILYNVYYSVDDASSIVEMGLITFNSKLTGGTIADAVDVIPGYASSGDSYMAHSNGIPAKNLGDALYFKVYAKLTNGSYVYSDVAGYHAVAYANSVLNYAGSTTKAKALVVAMLNYGAAAQTYFGYKTNSLMNASLTAEQKALVKSYSASMVADVVKADSSKVGTFVMNDGYSNIYPTVSFEGAFSINFYFTPNKTVDSKLTFYYWDAETYNRVSKLTGANATGKINMTQDGSNWGAAVEGIAAKDMDSTIYVAAVYTSNGTS